MKYLKSYEYHYPNVPKEKWWKGTEECSMDNAVEIIKGLKEWSFNDYKIERCFYGFPEIMLIDPKQYERQSANTKNYYTVIIDNSPLWKNFPKRKNSLICSLENNKEITENNNPSYYTVIPFDGSKWGHANTYDFWEAFKPHSLNSINHMIDKIMEEVLLSFPLDITISNLKKGFSKLDKEICDSYLVKNDNESFEKKRYKFYYNAQLFETIINAAKTTGIYEWYHDFLNPDKSGIKCYSYPELQKNQYLWGGDFEVWTDSKCLLIQRESLLEIKNKI